MRKTFFIVLAFVLLVIPIASAKERWREQRSRHFYIFYKNAPGDFVNSVEQAAEKYYDEITDNLGFSGYRRWSFEERAKIYIYDDHEDYLNGAKQAAWSHGAAYFHQKMIRTFPAAHGFFDSVLPHELGHIIFRDFIGPAVTVPLWMDEGVAMYQEQAKRWGAHKIVKEAIRQGNFIPLKQLSGIRLRGNMTQAEVDLFYAEAASVINFMIKEMGEHRFRDFCRKLRVGQNFYQALRNAYARFDELQDLEDAWLNFLERQ